MGFKHKRFCPVMILIEASKLSVLFLLHSSSFLALGSVKCFFKGIQVSEKVLNGRMEGGGKEKIDKIIKCEIDKI